MMVSCSVDTQDGDEGRCIHHTTTLNHLVSQRNPNMQKVSRQRKKVRNDRIYSWQNDVCHCFAVIKKNQTIYMF